MTPLRVAYYLSGHGFGHATRAVLVMEALHQRSPGLELHVRSVVSPALLAKYLRIPHQLTAVQLDATVVEADIFRIDVAATERAVRAQSARRGELIEQESRWLREAGINVVVFDAPPLAATIAAKAGVPSVAITNFTWDYIYEDYATETPYFAQAAQEARKDYGHTTLALRLPLGHSFDQFPRCEDVPLVARRTTIDRNAVRRELGVRDDSPVLVVALRGAATGLIVDGREAQVLSFGELEGPGIRTLEKAWDHRFSEVLAAGDLVLSKPGYGVCSECIANGRPLLHLPREGFRESRLLVDGMTGLVAHREVQPQDLMDGDRLKAICEEVLAEPVPEQCDVSGADVCAERILETAR